MLAKDRSYSNLFKQAIIEAVIHLEQIVMELVVWVLVTKKLSDNGYMRAIDDYTSTAEHVKCVRPNIVKIDDHYFCDMRVAILYV